jgi:peptidoglycan/LPS O-acetylase OafA/YrhL
VTSTPSPRLPAAIALAVVLDTAFVVLFVAIGRTSHEEGSALLGFLTTLWPFLAGAAIGWLVSRAWRAPMRIVWPGILIWAGAVLIGMLLRIVSGQGVQWSFVIVTAVVLGVFLIGWRAVALLVRRIRR